MTTDDKKDLKSVVTLFLAVSLVVMGSVIVDFNILDISYLLIIMFFIGKFIYIKVTNN